MQTDTKQEALKEPTSTEGDSSSIMESASEISTVIHEHESFETFQHKVYALGTELGLHFKDITRIDGGYNNRIIAVTIQDFPSKAGIQDTQAILRIPRGDRELDADGDIVPVVITSDPRILDDAAVLHLLAGRVPKVAEVLGFDSTLDNAIGFPYTLYTRMSGVNLASVLDEIPMEDMAVIASELAEFYTRLQDIKFPVSGRLLHDDDKEPLLTKLPPGPSERVEATMEVAVRGFLQNSGWDDERDGPTIPVTSSLYKQFEVGIKHALRPHEGYKPGEYDFHAELRDKLNSMLQEMKSMGWFDADETTTTDSVLHHWGCMPRNITAEQRENSSWHLTGIVDWDEIDCLPPVLTRRPPFWLWDRLDDDLLPEEMQRYKDDDFDFFPPEVNSKQLTAAGANIKEVFEKAIIMKCS
ncbi:hypothetical protein E4T42_05927 [Aureobasidium subglaciale]|nr:hypothetical protein E4T42_05927 [Aureobasidium subglaciale]